MCGIVCVYIYIMYMHVLHEASMKKHRHVVNEDESSGSSIHSRAPISIAQRIPGRSEKTVSQQNLVCYRACSSGSLGKLRAHRSFF